MLLVPVESERNGIRRAFRQCHIQPPAGEYACHPVPTVADDCVCRAGNRAQKDGSTRFGLALVSGTRRICRGLGLWRLLIAGEVIEYNATPRFHRATQRRGCFRSLRMIAPRTGSRTALHASESESHCTLRLPFSGQVLRCRITSNGNTSTSQSIARPCLRSFRYEKEPIGFFPICPTTPASSSASRAAAACGALRFIGQPLGMIQRPVPRDVTSITSVPEVLWRRNGSAAYCTRRAWDFRFGPAMGS